MYLINFKEVDFEFTSVKELFFINNKLEAIQVANELNDEVQEIIKKCKDLGILGSVYIPQLGVCICSTSNICKVEVIEVKRFEPLPDLSYEHLLA